MKGLFGTPMLVSAVGAGAKVERSNVLWLVSEDNDGASWIGCHAVQQSFVDAARKRGTWGAWKWERSSCALRLVWRFWRGAGTPQYSAGGRGGAEELHCYEDAKGERVNGILKQEYFLGGCFRAKQQAIKAADQAVWLYNTRRPHQALKYETPAIVHAKPKKAV